ncbi:hypothetical protein ACX9R5_08320 [Rathayibacter sp. CAU 1779]
MDEQSVMDADTGRDRASSGPEWPDDGSAPARERTPDATLAFPPHADHVFKEEDRTPAEVAGAPGNGCNDPDAHLDPESLDIILNWLGGVFAARAR